MRALPPSPSGMKRCAGCGETLPLARFHRNRSKADGRANYCKDCCKSYAPPPRSIARRSDQPAVVALVVISIEEYESRLPGGLVGRVVGRMVNGRIVRIA